jgi:hypothetical protein
VRRRWIPLGLAAILLLALGMGIGRRTASGTPDAEAPVTVTVTAPAAETRAAAPQPNGFARTREGSVEAATEYVATLGGPVILDPAAARATLQKIASSESRATLAGAYAAAAEQARERLGLATATQPVFVRSTPVGYRVDGFQPDAATVSIWRVGIIGGGATTEPRQSWRTETLSLVWEDGTWRIDALRSTPGPTPPLSGPAVTPPAELAATIPGFQEYAGGRP